MGSLGCDPFFALLRAPGAARGENRGIFTALILMSLAMALSIPRIYLFVDPLLGGVNAANLILRYSLFTVFLILGLKLAAAFNAQGAARFIGGPAGRCVLAASVLLVTVLFLLSDLPRSSPGLSGYRDQVTVLAYSDAGRLYTAYVAACLVPALSAFALNSRQPGDIRFSAGLIALGMSAAVVHTLLSLFVWGLERGWWDTLLNYAAVIVVAFGLALMWNSHRMAKKHPKPGLLARAYGSFDKE
ncbi:hypothetical protein OL239_00460 [Arthrobacter sp. ATA002]|uniref:hypothetical protein n=1 Tax=Arthrobacter sp. ATA002 TaxID=2991715 RepID=UPI0022A6F005|nr:hypothetical protein [Arthrobacter sp. ATA002]WAP51882.1 hypothetical protein OL239_00460 [Arthrobacter sp. ATA002]